MRQKPAHKTTLFIFTSFASFWVLLILLSKTAFSGYHFMDDSIIINYNQIINDRGLLYAINDYLVTDLQSRLRPVWVIEFIAGIYVKGSHFMLWSFTRALFIALTNTLLFAFAYNSGLSLRKSILFSLLIMLGQQAAILWMLGPAEVSGIFFMSLALYAIPHACEKKPFYSFLFIASAILMSLSKESFIFMLPAIYLWLLWSYSLKYHKTFYQSISVNLLPGLILTAAMLAELYGVYAISTKFAYAGADKNLGVLSYIKAFAFVLALSFSGLVSVAGFIFIFAKKLFRPRKWFYPLLLSAAIILPQVVIYTKSGFAERYFLPAVVGFVVLVIYQLQIIDKDPGNYSINKKMALVLSFLSVSVLASGLMLALSESFRLLIIKTMYSFRGAAVKAMNPIEIVAARSDANIQVIGYGVVLIGLVMVAGYITMMVLKIRTFRLYHGFMAIVLLSIGINLVSVFGLARKFAKDGESTNRFLAAIADNTKASDAILIVSDHLVQQEATYVGLPSYLNREAGRNNLFAYPVTFNPQDSVFGTFTLPEAYKPFTVQPFACVALFPETEKSFLNNASSWFRSSEYVREELHSGYVVYHK